MSFKNCRNQVRDQEVGGSNPLAPTNLSIAYGFSQFDLQPPVDGAVNLRYSERVWADWRMRLRNRQAAVTLRQTTKERDLKSRQIVGYRGSGLARIVRLAAAEYR